MQGHRGLALQQPAYHQKKNNKKGHLRLFTPCLSMASKIQKEKERKTIALWPCGVILRVWLEAGASSPTVFLSHIPPALASSHQPGNSVFLSHHSSSSLQLQPAEHGVYVQLKLY